MLFALTGCNGAPAPDGAHSADTGRDQTATIAEFAQALAISTESEAGASIGGTAGDISEVPSRVNLGSVSGKGPFTVYFTCQVPRGSVTLTLDSTTTTEVDCNAGTKKITGIQQIALAGGLNIEVQGEAKAGIWALVAKGKA
ncbi:hypothetical protein [Arthrobacter sp. MYb227]|uniref:hypothetical protein n=1 Tax=Arthrobacter sp. MYb227 TaxID=1848601 RepID=UPI0011B0C405|nr:hypothetical protein [Arthrobacter sp. MYb227]